MKILTRMATLAARALLGGAMLALLLALFLAAGGMLAVAAATKAQGAGGQRTAYVDVGVATSWVSPGLDRTVDHPAVSNPSDVRLWLENMSLRQEQRLIGDLETQALYGQKVVILKDQGEWLKVAVKGQPTPRNALGYPGWVPRRQLTFDTSLDAYKGKPFAQTDTKSTKLYNNRGLSSPFIKLSYATRLPVVGHSADAIKVATPEDGQKWLRATDATVYGSAASIPAPAGRHLVRTAKMFLGVPYLWAGTSGYGFDCSGFTYTVHRANGITIPRDTISREELIQPIYGRPIRAYKNLQPGDLAYFAYQNGTGMVHHVGMYIGDGKMIHAPRPGTKVGIVDIVESGWIKEYAGAIRYT
jgi:gamma-D-glutamyl-L-lysine dipeptidyl-peptidase